MVNGNAVSVWLMGARRTKSTAEIVAHAKFQASVDAGGRAFWNAVASLAERTK